MADHQVIHCTYSSCAHALHKTRWSANQWSQVWTADTAWYEQLTQQQDSSAISAGQLHRLGYLYSRPISHSSYIHTCCFMYVRIYVATVNWLELMLTISGDLWQFKVYSTCIYVRWSFSVTFCWQLLCTWLLSALAMEFKVWGLGLDLWLIEGPETCIICNW